MEDRLDEDLTTPAAPRAGWRGLLQRFGRAQTVPAPFRESDFEHPEWCWSALEAQPGGADQEISRAGR